MTVAEFFAWNPPGPYLWQLADGEPQQMAMANLTHGSLLAEFGSLISNHLDRRSSPCAIITMPGIIPRLLSPTSRSPAPAMRPRKSLSRTPFS
jgi:Uma2 family endonuclease